MTRPPFALLFLTLPFSLVEPQPNTYYDSDDLSPAIFVRSPMQPTQEGTSGPKGGRPFQFRGQQGTIVLEGVGKRLQAKQKAAEAERAGASFAASLAIARAFSAEEDMRKASKSRDKQNSGKRMRLAWSEYSKQEERSSQAVETKVQVGQDIKNIGLVNKDLRKRMMQCFQPLPKLSWKAGKIIKGAHCLPERIRGRMEAHTTTTRAKKVVARIKKSEVARKRGGAGS